MYITTYIHTYIHTLQHTSNQLPNSATSDVARVGPDAQSAESLLLLVLGLVLVNVLLSLLLLPLLLLVRLLVYYYLLILRAARRWSGRVAMHPEGGQNPDWMLARLGLGFTRACANLE